MQELVKQRTALLEKVTVTIADVREVEGRESGFPYSRELGSNKKYGSPISRCMQRGVTEHRYPPALNRLETASRILPIVPIRHLPLANWP